MQVTAVTRRHLLPFPQFSNMKRNFALLYLGGLNFGKCVMRSRKKLRRR